MNWILAAALVLSAAPRDIERFSAEELFVAGRLKADAGKILGRRAERIPSGAQVTAVVCLGVAGAPRAASVTGVGARVANAVRKAGTGLTVSWTARPESESTCPAGILLEIRPAVGRAVEVRWLRGDVEVVPTGSARRPAVVGEWLVNGTLVQTGAGARCGLRFADGSRVRLRPSSELRVGVRRDARKKTRRSWLKLSFGSIWARVVSATGAGSDFQVNTPNATAGVRGTDFAVTSAVEDGEANSRVETSEGTVAMTAGGQTVVVEAGYGAAAAGNGPPRKVALPQPPADLQPMRGEFQAAVPLSWRGDAASFRVEVAADVQFTELIVVETVTDSRWQLDAPAPGDLFWRVIAIDAEGFESPPSQLFRLKVIP